jgi:hypothetical protein
LIETDGVPWRYAAVMAIRPLDSVPAGARPSLRLRVRVVSGPVGIGLLNADQSIFLQDRRVQPSLEPQIVWLELGDSETAANSAPLVVHAWDTAESARVRLEEICIVW